MRHKKKTPVTDPGDLFGVNVGLSVAHIKSLPTFENLTEEESKRICMLFRLIAMAVVSIQSQGYQNDPLIATMTISELKEMIRHCISEAIPPPITIPVDEPLLKRKEIADILRISLVTLHQWMKEGRIPYHRIHSRIYFKPSEVQEALKRQDYRRVK